MKSLIDKNWTTPLSDLTENLQTGDIVLVHGRYAFSIVIESIEWSPFSHSAMVVRASDVGLAGKAPELLLWESNSLTNIADILSGQTKTGPMLVPLLERLQTTQQQFADVKFMTRPLHGQRSPALLQALQTFMPSVLSATFPSDYEMGKRVFEGRVLNKTAPLDQIFCSELLAFTYMHMGLLNRHYPANAYEPKDFTAQGTLALLQRAFLGTETYFNALL